MWSASPPTLLAARFSATWFAQVRFDPELLIFAILAIILIVLGCMVVVRVRSWRVDEIASQSLEDQLRSYQALVERGELDPQEFDKIKGRLQQEASEPPPS